MTTALITGITGQDGSMLAEFLLSRGYEVIGTARRSTWHGSDVNKWLGDRVRVLYADLSNSLDVAAAVIDSKPDEIYNLASQSRPGESWSMAAETLLVNGLGAVSLFETVRHHLPKCRVYHASSSEMFGDAESSMQDESTPFNPLNPYAAAKVYAHQMARIYRKSYGLFIANGILFNHESARRPIHFLTQKVAHGAACAALGILDSAVLNEAGHPIVRNGRLALGNLGISRDWGHAGDFVEAMWMMLQQDVPDDFVIGTGKLHTLAELCEIAYSSVGVDWQDRVYSDPALVRPLESSQKLANPAKAKRVLGWEPKVSFDEMIKDMVVAQISKLEAAGLN